MTEQQKDFVHMYLKHRDKIVAHNLAYGNNSNIASVESSANRLLRIPEIADTIRSIQDNIRHEVEEEFKAKYREELLTIYEKRLLLKKIATGEMYIEQKYKGKNCTQCSQYISPTYHMMMQALKEDSKLAGHYPHKQNGKWVIPAQQTEQEQNSNTPEKENNGQQTGFAQDQEISLPLRGIGGQLPQENAFEKENNGQQIGFAQDQEISLPFRGIGGQLPQENALEKDNKGQQLNETIIDNEPLTVEQKNTTETTPLLPAPTEGRGFLGGNIGASASGEDKRQSGRLTREEQETPDKNSLEKGNNQRSDLNEANEKDINKRIKRQHPEETDTDNQPLTNSLETFINPSGNIISQEKLKELLYPPKPKLSYMKNNT